MKKELIESYENTLKANIHLQEVFACVAKKLNLAEDDVLAGLLRYDDEIGEYDNTVYDDVRVRAALYLKYFVSGSYHIERQNMLTDMLKKCGDIKSIVDIGYGASGLYVRDYVLKNDDVRLSLLDKFESAADFSRALIECAYTETNWVRQINFGTFDFDENKSPGKFDAYVLFDSIEHAKDPTKSMDTIVADSPKNAQFILSLPICSMEGIEHVHFIEWLTDEDAKKWLEDRGLRVENQEKTAPTETDVWAEGVDFYNLVVRCTKI